MFLTTIFYNAHVLNLKVWGIKSLYTWFTCPPGHSSMYLNGSCNVWFQVIIDMPDSDFSIKFSIKCAGDKCYSQLCPVPYDGKMFMPLLPKKLQLTWEPPQMYMSWLCHAENYKDLELLLIYLAGGSQVKANTVGRAASCLLYVIFCCLVFFQFGFSPPLLPQLFCFSC